MSNRKYPSNMKNFFFKWSGYGKLIKNIELDLIKKKKRGIENFDSIKKSY